MEIFISTSGTTQIIELVDTFRQKQQYIAGIVWEAAPSSVSVALGTTILMTGPASCFRGFPLEFSRARRGRPSSVPWQFGSEFVRSQKHRSWTTRVAASRRSHHLRVHTLQVRRRGTLSSNRSARRTQSPSSPVLNVVIFFECVVRRLFVVLRTGPVLVMCTFLH